MKIHIRTEQYGFIEEDVDSVLDALIISKEVKALFYGSEASKLTDSEWRSALDTYLTSNTMHAEQYANMSAIQKYVIQEIKKSVKRIEAKK